MSVLKTENQLFFYKSAVIFYNEELLGVGKCVAIAINNSQNDFKEN